MRTATVCRPSAVIGSAIGLSGVVVAAGLLTGLAGCREDTRIGVLIVVRADSPEYRPEVVAFDWMAAGRRVLVSGELAAQNGTDDGLVGTLFIETRAVLEEPRLVALRGMRGGEIVSGSVALIEPTFVAQHRVTAQLGTPLPDSNNDGIPDIVETCTDPALAVQCLDPTPAPPPPPPDAAAPDAPEPAPDAPEEDIIPPVEDADPADAPLPDAPIDGPRDAARDNPASG